MRSFALSLLAVVGLSVAQEQYNIDPESVVQSTRDYWCAQQKAQCPIICSQQPGVTSQNTIANDCDADSLTYSCICEDNTSPNITKYTQTLPYYICTEWGTQCVSDCGQDNTCSDKCRADHPCGAQEPFKPNTTTTTSSTSSPTASETPADSTLPLTGLLGQTGTSEPGKGAANAMLDIAAGYTMAVTFAGVFIGFALL